MYLSCHTFYVFNVLACPAAESRPVGYVLLLFLIYFEIVFNDSRRTIYYRISISTGLIFTKFSGLV